MQSDMYVSDIADSLIQWMDYFLHHENEPGYDMYGDYKSLEEVAEWAREIANSRKYGLDKSKLRGEVEKEIKKRLNNLEREEYRAWSDKDKEAQIGKEIGEYKSILDMYDELEDMIFGGI